MKKLFIIGLTTLCLSFAACIDRNEEVVTDTIIEDTLTECVEDTNADATAETPAEGETEQAATDCE